MGWFFVMVIWGTMVVTGPAKVMCSVLYIRKSFSCHFSRSQYAYMPYDI